MLNLLKRLMLTDDTAQDLAEYGIALAVIGLGAGAACIAMASDIAAVWSQASSIIATAAG